MGTEFQWPEAKARARGIHGWVVCGVIVAFAVTLMWNARDHPRVVEFVSGLVTGDVPERDRPLVPSFLCVLGGVGVLGVAIAIGLSYVAWESFAHRGTTLTLDREGVALERQGERRSWPWEAIRRVPIDLGHFTFETRLGETIRLGRRWFDDTQLKLGGRWVRHTRGQLLAPLARAYVHAARRGWRDIENVPPVLYSRMPNFRMPWALWARWWLLALCYSLTFLGLALVPDVGIPACATAVFIALTWAGLSVPPWMLKRRLRRLAGRTLLADHAGIRMRSADKDELIPWQEVTTVKRPLHMRTRTVRTGRKKQELAEGYLRFASLSLFARLRTGMPGDLLAAAAEHYRGEDREQWGNAGSAERQA